MSADTSSTVAKQGSHLKSEKGNQSKAVAFRKALENIEDFRKLPKSERDKMVGEYVEHSTSVLARYIHLVSQTLTRADWATFPKLVTSFKTLHAINYPHGANGQGAMDMTKLFGSVGPGMMKMVDQRKTQVNIQVNGELPTGKELIENIHREITSDNAEVIDNIEEAS